MGLHCEFGTEQRGHAGSLPQLLLPSQILPWQALCRDRIKSVCFLYCTAGNGNTDRKNKHGRAVTQRPSYCWRHILLRGDQQQHPQDTDRDKHKQECLSAANSCMAAENNFFLDSSRLLTELLWMDRATSAGIK